MIVYVDLIFIENMIINYAILYMTIYFNHGKKSHVKIFASSLIGSAYAVISIISNNIIINNAIIKILLSLIMVYIICPYRNMKKIREFLIMFYVISLIAGGLSVSLEYILFNNNINIKNGIIIVNSPSIISAIGLILGIIIIKALIRNIHKRIPLKNIYYDIEIVMNMKKIKIKGLLDTGNMLKEPISKSPVIIVTKSSIERLLSTKLLKDIKLMLEGDKIGDVTNYESIKRIRLIPFSSIGNEHGILIGIKPDKVLVDNFIKNDVIIGIYEKKFSKIKRYDALIGLNLFNEEEFNNEIYRKIKKQHRNDLCKIYK